MSLTVKQLSEDCLNFAKYINENQKVFDRAAESEVTIECKVFGNGNFDVLVLTKTNNQLILELRWSKEYSKWYILRRQPLMNVIRVVEGYVENSMNKGYSKLFKVE